MDSLIVFQEMDTIQEIVACLSGDEKGAEDA